MQSESRDVKKEIYYWAEASSRVQENEERNLLWAEASSRVQEDNAKLNISQPVIVKIPVPKRHRK